MSAEAGAERASYAWIPQVCLCVNLRMASRVVTQLYDDVFAPTGLRSTQFPILLALALSGSSPLTRLAEMLAMDRTTLTRNLRPLEARGWVRAMVGDDHRTRVVALTEAGRAVLDDALPYWERGHERVTEALGETFSSQLVAELKQTVDRLRER
jgi:DNA-binding MarR family transcriptional regulator